MGARGTAVPMHSRACGVGRVTTVGHQVDQLPVGPGPTDLAHSLIPGGCHTYAKGDDQYPMLAPRFIVRGAGCRVWDADGNEYIEYGMGNRAVAWGTPIPRSCRRRSANFCAAATSRGRPRSRSRAPKQFLRAHRWRRNGQILQGRLGRDLRGRAAGPRLYRPRPDRLLRRPSLLLDRRLVHRHHPDERRHSGGDAQADRHLPLQRHRQRQGAVRRTSRPDRRASSWSRRAPRSPRTASCISCRISATPMARF